MTEDEAKNKWCPFTRAKSDEGFASINRGMNGDPLLNKTSCLGSACMAWRLKTRSYNVTNDEWQENSLYMRSDKIEERPTGHGYCGLAGSP